MFSPAFITLHLLVFRVISTINLYYKRFLNTDKINDIVANDMLSVKLEPEFPTPQIFP